MFIRDLLTADAMPALEATMRFASQRHRLIANNIANIDTPNYRTLDVSVTGFQKMLGDAIDNRRSRFGGHRGDLSFRSTREIAGTEPGNLTLRPTAQGGLLFHDRSTKDLERTMQDLVENTATYQLAANLYASRARLLESAISERV
jgi:flagellar basal-body rod protein FlgB